MIYTILQLVRTVSLVIDLINEDVTTISGILKAGQGQPIQRGFEARTTYIIE